MLAALPTGPVSSLDRYRRVELDGDEQTLSMRSLAETLVLVAIRQRGCVVAKSTRHARFFTFASVSASPLEVARTNSPGEI